jgi:pimeloyl-ACP methyl ester carboxylesterase
LTYPADYSSETPVVLLVSGSGPQNRDEEVYAHKPFLVIADHLARNGIASLRYDDRGVGKSTGNAVGATTETFKKDASSGLEFLRSLRKFSKVGLAGHSEGGTIAFLLAGEGRTDFMISLAGTVTDGATALVEQNRKILKGSGIPESAVNDYCEVLAKLYADPDMTAEELGKLASGLAPDMKQNIMRIRETKDPWVQHFISFDPGEAIRKIECPVLALNGENDVQVIADSNIPRLQELLKDNGKNMIKTYPGLNHLFQHCTTGMPDEYGKIEETISAEVLTDITEWIKKLD